jgi:hypothetical protein
MNAARAITLTCVVLLAGPGIVGAQTSPQQLKGVVISLPVHNLPAGAKASLAPQLSPNVTPNSIPLWTYSVAAYNNTHYSGTIMGASPYNHGKTTTTIPTQIIPLVITITDSNGTYVYDPTVEDTACVPGHTPAEIIADSPIFTNEDWTMNGTDVGTTQYEDANVRAEFWKLLGNTPYHLVLQESTLASQALSFGTGGTSGAGVNYPAAALGTCEPLGIVNIDQMDAAIAALITGPLAGTVNVGTFPLFVTKNVVMSEVGVNLLYCCVLGYHSAFNVGANLQVYSPLEVDTAKVFEAGYTSTIAHEVGEAIHDPNGINPTPAWGAEGQVPAGSCQNNFEVGDPLSGSLHPWSVMGGNGVTYGLQELAFFNWFYGDPNLAASGYSNNGSFTGFAKACPPGGTN